MTARKSRIAAFIIIAAAAAIELAMGRHPICTCGTIDLWVGSRDSPKTSQMLADWYSLSHVVHGLLFYAVLWLVFRRWPVEADSSSPCADRGRLGNHREHADGHRPLSRDDGRARLQRRQRHQLACPTS